MGPTSNQIQPGAVFTNPTRVSPSAVDLKRASFTANGAFISYIFDEFRIEMQPNSGPLQMVRSVSFLLPYTVPNDRAQVGFLSMLRYTVSEKTAGSRISLLASVGFTSYTLDFDYGEAIKGSSLTKSSFSIDRIPKKNQPGVHPVPAPFLVSLGLIAQRRSPGEMVLCSVDSLDIEAILQ